MTHRVAIRARRCRGQISAALLWRRQIRSKITRPRRQWLDPGQQRFRNFGLGQGIAQWRERAHVNDDGCKVLVGKLRELTIRHLDVKSAAVVSDALGQSAVEVLVGPRSGSRFAIRSDVGKGDAKPRIEYPAGA